MAEESHCLRTNNGNRKSWCVTLRPPSLALCTIAMSCACPPTLSVLLFILTFSSAAYSGTALAFRDRLIIEWNKTQQRQTFTDQKRVYCTFQRIAVVLSGSNTPQIFHWSF